MTSDGDSPSGARFAFEVMSVLLNFKEISPLAAQVVHKAIDGVIRRYTVEAIPARALWAYRDERTGRLFSNRSGMTESPFPSGRPPEPVRLAFPMDLPIWGRRFDQLRPAGVRQLGPLAVVSLRPLRGNAAAGSLTVNTQLGIATEFVGPLGTWTLADPQFGTAKLFELPAHRSKLAENSANTVSYARIRGGQQTQ